MNPKQFLNLKKQVDKLLGKVEEEALERGDDISSFKYLDALNMIKQKILARKGIDLKEYEGLEKLSEQNLDSLDKESFMEFGAEVDKEIRTLKEKSDQQNQFQQKVTNGIGELMETIESQTSISKSERKQLRDLLLGEIKKSKEFEQQILQDIQGLEEEKMQLKESVQEKEKTIEQLRSDWQKEKETREKKYKELDGDLNLIGEAITKLFPEK